MCTFMFFKIEIYWVVSGKLCKNEFQYFDIFLIEVSGNGAHDYDFCNKYFSNNFH